MPRGAQAAPTTPQALRDAYAAAAGQPADAARGQALFTARHGREWSCSQCHGQPPTQDGQHASTGKRITPLAPAYNATRFTDDGKTEKWFRRNCSDVLGRACSPAEKADVLAYLISLK
nr:DUF1924 domain-containing protein [Ideonella livida]